MVQGRAAEDDGERSRGPGTPPNVPPPAPPILDATSTSTTLIEHQQVGDFADVEQPHPSPTPTESTPVAVH